MARAGEGDRSGLVVRDLRLARGGRAVLRGVELAVPRGAVTVVRGDSGSGKSTLLRCCNGLLAPDGGSVALDGADAAALEPCALRRRVGLVAQQPVMLPGSVRENLAYALPEPDAGGPGEHALAAALAAAGLERPFLDRPAAELSGGERARVALARALTRGPDVLLLDEPTAALDAHAADHVAATLRRLAAEGLGLLVVTHDDGFAAAVADRTLALRDGVVVADEAAAR